MNNTFFSTVALATVLMLFAVPSSAALDEGQHTSRRMQAVVAGNTTELDVAPGKPVASPAKVAAVKAGAVKKSPPRVIPSKAVAGNKTAKSSPKLSPKPKPKPSPIPKPSPKPSPLPSPKPSPLPSPKPSPAKSKSKSSTPIGAVAGGVVAGFLIAVILGAVLYYFCVYKKKKDAPYADANGAASKFLPVAVGRGGAGTRQGIDQGPMKPSGFVVGRDPGMLASRMRDLSQASQAFSNRFHQSAPAAFWQTMLAPATTLAGAVVDQGQLATYLLQQGIWSWCQYHLWARSAPLARAPVFPSSKSADEYGTCLDSFRRNPEDFGEFTAQVSRQLAEDLQLPAESVESCQRQLLSLVESAVEIRLAVGAVDPNAGMWVTPLENPSSPTIKLSPPVKGRHYAARVLALDPSARGRVNAGVAMCYLPGIGHPSGAYAYEEEQVVALGSA